MQAEAGEAPWGAKRGSGIQANRILGMPDCMILSLGTGCNRKRCVEGLHPGGKRDSEDLWCEFRAAQTWDLIHLSMRAPHPFMQGAHRLPEARHTLGAGALCSWVWHPGEKDYTELCRACGKGQGYRKNRTGAGLGRAEGQGLWPHGEGDIRVNTQIGRGTGCI